MTAELSRDLALALGYYPESVRVCTPTYCEVFRHRGPDYAYTPKEEWRRFDYTQPDVALPLLEMLMREHGAILERQAGQYWLQVGNVAPVRCIDADTLEEAIARAVIAVKGEK